MRDNLQVHLDGIEVLVSACDMASLQQVMFYKRYETTDLQPDSVFVNTLSESSKTKNAGSGQQLEADHSKLDKFGPEEPQANGPSFRKKPRKDSLLSKPGGALRAAASAGFGLTSSQSSSSSTNLSSLGTGSRVRAQVRMASNWLPTTPSRARAQSAEECGNPMRPETTVV